MIRRGDIRWFRFASPDKRRPVLVVCRDDLIESLAQRPVVPLSTQMRGLPWKVQLLPAEGLPSACVLKPEWVRSIDKTHLGPLIASFPAARWDEVRDAVHAVMGFSR